MRTEPNKSLDVEPMTMLVPSCADAHALPIIDMAHPPLLDKEI